MKSEKFKKINKFFLINYHRINFIKIILFLSGLVATGILVSFLFIFNVIFLNSDSIANGKYYHTGRYDCDYADYCNTYIGEEVLLEKYLRDGIIRYFIISSCGAGLLVGALFVHINKEKKH